MKTSLLGIALMCSSFRLCGQAPPIGKHCAARVCEESTIYAVALDSLLRRPDGEQSNVPRIFKRLYLSPFNAFNTAAPVVGVLDDLRDGSIFRRYWRGAQIVDSAQVVDSDGHTLSPGGPLYIFSPIDWLGQDAVRFQVAEYPGDLNWGAQLFLFARRGQQGWIVTEISVGIQN